VYIYVGQVMEVSGFYYLEEVLERISSWADWIQSCVMSLSSLMGFISIQTQVNIDQNTANPWGTWTPNRRCCPTDQSCNQASVGL